LPPDGCAHRVAEGADTGFDPASHGAPGSGSQTEGGSAMLDKRNQGRAISLSDGGRAGGNTRRAEISACSRFVLRVRASGRVGIAGLLTISLMVGIAVNGRVFVGSCHPVSIVSDGCAHRVAEGADTGFDPASHGAPGSGSARQKKSPGELCPGTRGREA